MRFAICIRGAYDGGVLCPIISEYGRIRNVVIYGVYLFPHDVFYFNFSASVRILRQKLTSRVYALPTIGPVISLIFRHSGSHE